MGRRSFGDRIITGAIAAGIVVMAIAVVILIVCLILAGCYAIWSLF